MAAIAPNRVCPRCPSVTRDRLPALLSEPEAVNGLPLALQRAMAGAFDLAALPHQDGVTFHHLRPRPDRARRSSRGCQPARSP